MRPPASSAIAAAARPTGAVAVASVGDGFLRARTPVLDFHKGYCDFCGKCIEVCPTGALRSFDETAEKLGVAVVQKDRCLSYFQGCTVCEDSCAFDALAFVDGHPVVDGDACNGCGQCEFSARRARVRDLCRRYAAGHRGGASRGSRPAQAHGGGRRQRDGGVGP
ncbi:MAG: 4Fe-4S binding protein [Adlercreutzia equolifaciens]